MYKELLSKSGLSLSRLSVLCEVIQSGTISKAVDGDPCRASHYSRQIAELESFFGTKLFLRKNRRLIPSQQALHLASVARSFFLQIHDFKEELEGREPTLRIGAQESVIKWILMPHIAAWQTQFPDVKFNFQNHRTPEMVEGLTEAKLDLAVIREEALTPELTAKACCPLTYALFIPKSIRPALPKKISIKILKGLPLATLSHHGRFSSHLNDLQDEIGESLDIQATCNSFSLIVEMMKVRDLAAILPSVAERDLSSDAFHVVQPFFLAPFERTLVLAHLRNESLIRPFARNIGLLMSQSLSN